MLQNNNIINQITYTITNAMTNSRVTRVLKDTVVDNCNPKMYIIKLRTMRLDGLIIL